MVFAFWVVLLIFGFFLFDSPTKIQIGVNPDLYYLVFGESLLNDGVAVVLYDMMNIFVGMENAGEAVTFGQVINYNQFLS